MNGRGIKQLYCYLAYVVNFTLRLAGFAPHHLRHCAVSR